MISPSTLSKAAIIGGGVLGAGMMGYNHISRRDDVDMSDRLGYTGMSAISGGIAAAAGMGAIGRMGVGGMGRAGKTMYNAARIGKKVAMWDPVGNFRKARGISRFGMLPKAARGPLAMLAIAGAAVGAIAYSARSNPETAAYATSNGMGGYDYSDEPSVRDRSRSIGASGDMVFGLNNLRHG